MKKVVIVFTVIISSIGCTDLNEKDEQLIQQQEIQGIDLNDDGTIDDEKQRETKKMNRLSPILKGIMAFVIVTMSLYNVFLKPTSKTSVENKILYKKEIKKRNLLQNNYLESLKKNQLTTIDMLKNGLELKHCQNFLK